VVVESLHQVGDIIQSYRPRKKWYRRFISRSAVALILRESESGLEALMIKRSEREGDPWSGHMAFPGGRVDESDVSILHTARRETWEEIGLDTEQQTRFLGRLSDVMTGVRAGRTIMVITPYIFAVDKVPEFNINHEVAEIVWVPLNFLADTKNRQQMQWQYKKVSINLPCYFYQQRRIWGLSLAMLDELLGLVKK
jgi:8-oxo-dGTP pyrophosphatase MutT (NUDIX family)